MSTPVASAGLILSVPELAGLAGQVIAQARPFGFDIETGYEGETREDAQLHPETNHISGISFTNDLSWARYVPLLHDDGTNVDNAGAAYWFWLMVATGLGVPHNGKFELRTMSRWFLEHLADHPEVGAAVRASRGYFPLLSDSMIEAFSEGLHESYGLKQLTLRDTGYQMAEILSLFPAALTQKQQKAIRFSVLDQHDPKVYGYACEDSVEALRAHLMRYPRLVGSPHELLYRADMYVVQMLCDMEDEGVCYDWNMMREGAAKAGEFRGRLTAEVHSDLSRLLSERGIEEPCRINLNSTAQVGHVLYDQLGFTTHVLTDGGKSGERKMSTGKIALKGLSKDNPVIRKILNWKSLTRLQGTYLEKYPPKYDYADDGRAHPNHLQVVVPSGRFAVADPPYQQSPKKYHYELEHPCPECEAAPALASCCSFDFNFRDVIMSPPGWYMLGFDYSQIELRVIAGEAGETALLEAFARGDDVHKLTASLMLGKLLADITSDDRAIGKTMNFALMYQMGVDGLADRLGITEDEARALFEQYFAAYPRIKSWIDRTVAQARSCGYTISRFGRRCTIWPFEKRNRGEYVSYRQMAEGERLAGNAPIQGGAADYMKIAMVRADKALAAAGLKDRVRLVMNIHDALMWYVRDDVPPRLVIDALMEAVVFPVEGWPPMVAEWHAGRRWGSVRELELLPGGGLGVKGEQPAAPVRETDGEEDEDGGPALELSEADIELLRKASGGLAGAAGAGGASGHPAEADGGDGPDGPQGGVPGLVHGGLHPGIPSLPPASDLPVPRTVIIEPAGVPTQEGCARLAAALQEIPGINTVVLRLPDGDLTFGIPCSLSPPDGPAAAMLLGCPASVFWAPDSVDMAALAAGIVT